MTIDLSKNPDYSAVITTLIDKTKAGKLSWTATSQPNTYVSAVKGIQTYRLSLLPPDQNSPKTLSGQQISTFFEVDDVDAEDVLLTVTDSNGKVLFTVRQPSLVRRNAGFDSGIVRTLAGELFKLAQRIADRVDENVDAALQLLNAL